MYFFLIKSQSNNEQSYIIASVLADKMRYEFFYRVNPFKVT